MMSELTHRSGMMPRSQFVDFLRRTLGSRRLRATFGFALLVAFGYTAYFFFWRFHLKRFTVVAPGIFYRVAQPTEFGLRHLADHYAVRTVVSLQLFDLRLYRGLVAFGDEDGDRESQYTAKLGLRHVQWPMGDEVCWPWPGTWELQEFYRLIDDPDNRPVLIHCQGGRHRTGTMTALYRLEYEHRPVAEVLEEMYSYAFGHPIPAQERNLRTYVPRPVPTAAEWPEVAAAFGIDKTRSPLEAIPILAIQIRRDGEAGRLRATLNDALSQQRPYALALASRVIDDLDDPLIPIAVPMAREILQRRVGSARDVTAAAAIIADFGTNDDQRLLLELVESQGGESAEFYEAVVCGIANRFTSNRLAYLKPLLTDRRPRPNPEAGGLTYADTAVVRVIAITDGLPIGAWSDQTLTENGPQWTLDWLNEHPQQVALSRLVPPPQPSAVLQADGPQEEDLSKMRR